MIFQLIKRDPAWRAMWWLTSGTAVLWPLTGSISRHFLHPVFAALLVPSVLAAFGEENATSFLSALPVTARQVYLARALAIAGLVWLPVIVGLVLIFAGLIGGVGPDTPLLLCAFSSFVGLVLIGLESAWMKAYRPPRQLVNAVLFGACSVALIVAAASRSVEHLAAPLAGCFLAGTAIIFERTWRVLANGWILPFAKPSARVAPAHVLKQTWYWRFALLRSLYAWNDLFWLPLVFLQAAIGSPLSVLVFMFIVPGMSIARRWLDPLPVSRRFILLTGIVPTVFVLLAGYCTHVWTGWLPVGQYSGIREATTQTWPPSTNQPRCGRFNIMPPLEHWQPASAGGSAIIRAPWGETFQPPVITVLRTHVSNPYAVGCANTRAFFDWQLARATSAVYGKFLTPGEATRDRHTSARPGPARQILTMGALASFAMLIFVLLGSWRFHKVQQLPIWLGWTVGGIFFAGILAFSLLGGTTGLEDGVQWLLWHLPAGSGPAAALSLSAPLALYCLLEWFTNRAEYPVAPASPGR